MTDKDKGTVVICDRHGATKISSTVEEYRVLECGCSQYVPKIS